MTPRYTSRWTRPSAAHWALTMCLVWALGATPISAWAADSREVKSGEWLSLQALDYDAPDPDRNWVDYLTAAGVVTLANVMVWGFNRFITNTEFARISVESICCNFVHGFNWDNNSFTTNMFGHPYHGHLYYTGARAAGLSFWESSLYTAFGSLMWEFAGETHRPAINDFIGTTLGGITVGEVLYRFSNAVLDNSASGVERVLRELGGAAFSPVNAFYRLTSGRMWKHGAPPLRKPIDLTFWAGANFVTVPGRADPDPDPGVMFAFDVTYGDLETLGRVSPYSFFDIFSSLSFAGEGHSGSFLIQGMLAGWDWGGGAKKGNKGQPGSSRSVFALVQSFDYSRGDVVEYGGPGLGAANYWVWRLANGFRVRVDLTLEGVPLGGMNAPSVADTGRTYNFGMGGRLGFRAALRMPRWGNIRLWTKHMLMAVVDGADGSEFIGLARLDYVLPLYKGWGLGASATQVHRIGTYDDFEDFSGRAYSFNVALTYVTY